MSMLLRVIPKNQTVTTDGSQSLVLSGRDDVTINIPEPSITTFSIFSNGNNHVAINELGITGYTANTTVNKGSTLALDAQMDSAAAINITGDGKVVMTASIGGRRGASPTTVDAKDYGSDYTLLHNGTLGFTTLAFLQQADSITLNDSGSPVGNIGGDPPELDAQGLSKITHASWSEPGGLALDFANGKHAVVALHFAAGDDEFYSLIQQKNGDVAIKATVVGFGLPDQPFVYAAPPTPKGGHVFQL